MAHPYGERNDLDNLLGDLLVAQLLDLNKDGAEDAGVYDAVREEADAEIDSCLGQKYVVPFNRTTAPTVPDIIRVISNYLSAALLLAKRHQSAEQVTFYAGRATRLIEQIQQGKKTVIYADGEEAALVDSSSAAIGLHYTSGTPVFGGVDDDGNDRMSGW